MKKNVKLITLGTCALGSLASCADSQPSKPNIIVILADDMGYGDVSALNPDAGFKTPVLDSLAHNGVIFTDAHTPSSVSTPTRYGLLTGRYNWRSTLKSDVVSGYSKPIIAEDRQTLASMLNRGGYNTACIGKWHLGWEWNFTQEPTNINELSENGKGVIDYNSPITRGPADNGFDYFYGFSGSLDMPPYVYVENDKATALPDRKTVNTGKYSWWRKGDTGADFDHQECLPNLTNKAIEFIKKSEQGDEPFFLYLPYPGPHTPILPSEKWEGASGLNPYADFTMMVDAEIGRITQTLKDLDIDQNTLIIFTTDNGCSPAAQIGELIEKGHYPNYIYRGAKADLYEGGHRVPFIVYWPEGTKKGISKESVCLTDIYRTFAQIAGVSLGENEGEDSYSFVKALQDPQSGKIGRGAIVHHSIRGDFAIRRGDWKLLLVPHSGGWSAPNPANKKAWESLPPMQLYNLKEDPSETTNLYEKHPEVVKELKALLIRYIKEGRSTQGETQTNDGPFPWKQIESFVN